VCIILILVLACFCAICMMAEGGCEAMGHGCTCDAVGFDCDACFLGDSTQGIGAGFYYGGTFPIDPFWGSGGYGYSTPPSRPHSFWKYIWYPVAWLIYVCPAFPENAWGGLCGYIMGTHMNTAPENVYQGGNCIVEFLRMGWRRRGDLHGEEAWRQQVREFLRPDVPDMISEATPELVGEDVPLRTQDVSIGRARAILINRQFDKVVDQCIDSSFEDYEQNSCWICFGQNPQWDLWLSCHHIFCAECSTKMLQRGMPCPLCRVFSSVVLRGEVCPPAT